MNPSHTSSLATKLALLFETMLKIDIHVNGAQTHFDNVDTVADLLFQLGRGDVPCAVEVNEQLVPKSKHALHQLRQGDRVELVTLVGGG